MQVDRDPRIGPVLLLGSGELPAARGDLDRPATDGLEGDGHVVSHGHGRLQAQQHDVVPARPQLVLPAGRLLDGILDGLAEVIVSCNGLLKAPPGWLNWGAGSSGYNPALINC